ncbi:membrane protein insertase YidC [Altererythrobacter sp. FM1]|uniref:membrane protein insertase YidC n=1 Tax=Tsuneonella flava TaxID=2055955 RepID=UPI000C8068FD|nr:membrane protein insertase YidC [Tsuneonella flava]ROT93798.1 membrane protein insertase YidC [Altererythrobacter sp. FM1]UBS33077.1 membrane protein insertase YidC [Altererythrobacter sp. N1]
MNNQRNLIFAVVLCGLLLFGWEAIVQRLYPQPDQPAKSAAAAPAIPGDGKAASSATPADDKSIKHTREGGLTDPAQQALEARDLKAALADPNRVKIAAPEVAGSIDLVGAKIDDLTLTSHSQSVEKDSGPVRLFSPDGTPAQYFAQFGWIGQGVKVPDAKTVWQASEGPLAPDNPVTLTWNNGVGQQFKIELSVDDKYLITARQTVANTGGQSVIVRPFALINRTSTTASIDQWTIHSGPIGEFGDGVNFGTNYKDVAESGTTTPDGKAGWIGFTDIYWLSALVPQSNASVDADFRALGNDIFRADVIYDALTVPSGRQISRTTQMFAGAKESDVLTAYQKAGIPQFSNAIDWGWFGIVEKPILWLLKHLYDFAGNFGVAIILLTLIVRGLMFPIAQKQFASMAAMKAIQPKMKALQDRYKDDKQKQQQEIMALYKAEGVNPLAGCLPMLLQIPIFFGLYKVLMLSIDMRHKPFILWIKDLSAPDPLHILNLFGLLPFTPPSFLGIGVLAVLLGITMWATFRLNPTAMDPIQRQMFSLMPWIMMFVMAPFAAGLLLYWITSNLLTVAQQSYLYSKHPQLKAQADKDKVDQERSTKAKG